MEKVGIEINLIGADKAQKTLEAIESTTRRLGAKKTMIQMEDGSLKSVEERIKEIQDRLAVLRSQKKLHLLDANQKREMERLNAELTVLNRGLKNGTANARTFKQVFNSISSTVAHVGSAMQSMGNALTRIGSFMRPITTGLLMGAGYNALNLVTEGFGNAFERADTMRNYDRQLKALGLDVAQTFSVAGKEAKTAKENLDDAVQGLPTSLDEIMAAQKVYAGATGEMVNSTKTAIAANNSFLASGMGAREQRFMQKYLVALSSGAELTTTQWQSMERIAPLVMRSVSKELGYAGDAYSEFRDDVEHGRIAGEDFLKAFQKVGISGAVADAARAQTESWNGLFSNIRIAVTRMGA
ncbi:MAG: tape measure protein, partial [Acutalibacteraceae bacterium]|nr:tape measure protein [Acutalibacteraceae bacterium]